MIQLIGLFGAKQVGKDTSATIINDLLLEHEFLINRKRFAKPVKEILSLLTGIPPATMEYEDVKNRLLGEEWDCWEAIAQGYDSNGYDIEIEKLFSTKTGAEAWLIEQQKGLDGVVIWEESFRNYRLTIREALELLGTSLLRKQFHPDVFVNAAFKDYGIKDPFHDITIFCDGRFRNEAQRIRDLDGINIHIVRNTGLPVSIAEEEVNSIDYDYIVDNNGSKADLCGQLHAILIKEGILEDKT